MPDLTEQDNETIKNLLSAMKGGAEQHRQQGTLMNYLAALSADDGTRGYDSFPSLCYYSLQLIDLLQIYQQFRTHNTQSRFASVHMISIHQYGPSLKADGLKTRLFQIWVNVPEDMFSIPPFNHTQALLFEGSNMAHQLITEAPLFVMVSSMDEFQFASTIFSIW
jgi:hypothetical protein